jgi:flagellar biosynthetic protein FliO
MPELWTLLRVVVSLAVVLALAVVALRFGLPRLMGMGALGGPRTRRLQVLESAPLDRQHRVALVRVGGREYLLGVGSAQVTALDSWPAAGAEGETAPEAAAATPALSVAHSSDPTARAVDPAAPPLRGRLDAGARP